MNPESPDVGKTGLRFFGVMTASISHEIKNVLAIINENAGLMKDLVLMAEQGRPLNLDKVKTLADRFGQQVARADRIVKNLNQFSHTIDEFVKEVDLGEALNLALALANRFISMKNVAVELNLPATAGAITTHPFLLNNLLWFCIEYAIEHPGENKHVTIRCQDADAGISVSFDGLKHPPEGSTKSLFSKEGESLLHYLGATLKIDTHNNSFAVRFPRVIESHKNTTGENR